MRIYAALAAPVVGLFLVSCSIDTPNTPGIQADVQCNDDPQLCGPTDGTLHDGTGNGTLIQVAGDPSPSAPGVWLGWFASGEYCYANYNSLMNDGDDDWLDDECEYQLAKAFAPVLAISQTDGCDKGEPYWAVKYFPNDPTYGWGEFVRIAYMPAYYRDCGIGGVGAHIGDSEFLMVGVEYNSGTQHWQLRDMYLSAHAGEVTNSSEYIFRDNVEYPARQYTYPRTWIARGKHGFYKSQDACTDGAFHHDSCGDNYPVGRMRIYRGHNVGSRFLDRFPGGVASGNPLYANNYRHEYFWTPTERFKGWQVTSEDGATPYVNMLMSNVYECFDPSYTFGGQCYWGPGPSAPTWTKLTAWIDGPTQVTAFQTYTWSSFATGGTLPYRAEWWRQYAYESTPTLVATSTSNGGAYTAGSLTTTVDRCQNFVVTLKVWSNDGQYWTRSASVTTACPPPPVTVYIDGPGMISTKATYTFTAVTSGTTSPTFTWKERFCDYMNGTSCTAWQTITGLGNTFRRTLNKDCSGTGEKNYQLHVDVRNSDGRTASDDHIAALCQYL